MNWLEKIADTYSDLPPTEEFHALQPHIFQPGASRIEAGRKFDALPDTAMVWVFHSTDEKTANEILSKGLALKNKPSNLARMRFEQGEYAEFAPGRGLSAGTYVGANPQDVSGYGRKTLAIHVQKHHLGIPPEQQDLGETSVGIALSMGDAIILSDVPAENIFEIGETGKYPGSAYQELQKRRRP